MDTNLTVAIVIIIFALIVVAAFMVFRQRAKVEIKGPGDTGLKLDASNAPPPLIPGVTIEGAKSRQGGLVADDQTGRGVNLKDIDTQDDILATSAPPKPDGDPKV
jgi:hypothetical protein